MCKEEIKKYGFNKKDYKRLLLFNIFGNICLERGIFVLCLLNKGLTIIFGVGNAFILGTDEALLYDILFIVAAGILSYLIMLCYLLFYFKEKDNTVKTISCN